MDVSCDTSGSSRKRVYRRDIPSMMKGSAQRDSLLFPTTEEGLLKEPTTKSSRIHLISAHLCDRDKKYGCMELHAGRECSCDERSELHRRFRRNSQHWWPCVHKC